MKLGFEKDLVSLEVESRKYQSQIGPLSGALLRDFLSSALAGLDGGSACDAPRGTIAAKFGAELLLAGAERVEPENLDGQLRKWDGGDCLVLAAALSRSGLSKLDDTRAYPGELA